MTVWEMTISLILNGQNTELILIPIHLKTLMKGEQAKLLSIFESTQTGPSPMLGTCASALFLFQVPSAVAHCLSTRPDSFLVGQSFILFSRVAVSQGNWNVS